MNKLNVTSEIKPLKEVLVHRPGKELLNLTPNTLQELLFDDIPFLKDAQAEHDEFVQILRDNDIEVFYLEDLMAETLDANPKLKPRFIKKFIKEAGINTPKYRDLVYDYLMSIKNTKTFVLKTMEGIQISELDRSKRVMDKTLVDLVTEESDFIVDPMPNLYFTRDPFATIGSGISLNKMYSVTRSRETIYAEFIFNHHPKYKGLVSKCFYNFFV